LIGESHQSGLPPSASGTPTTAQSYCSHLLVQIMQVMCGHHLSMLAAITTSSERKAPSCIPIYQITPPNHTYRWPSCFSKSFSQVLLGTTLSATVSHLAQHTRPSPSRCDTQRPAHHHRIYVIRAAVVLTSYHIGEAERGGHLRHKRL
jgi:hypothetical protein